MKNESRDPKRSNERKQRDDQRRKAREAKRYG